MAGYTPREVMRLWFEEVWNNRRSDLPAKLLAPDCLIHATDEEGGDTVGPEAFLAFQAKMLAAFPDIRFTMHEIVADEQMAAGRWTATMTHAGPGMGEPTGATVTVGGMSMIRLKDGVGVEGWNEWDRLGMAVAVRRLVPAG